MGPQLYTCLSLTEMSFSALLYTLNLLSTDVIQIDYAFEYSISGCHQSDEY